MQEASLCTVEQTEQGTNAVLGTLYEVNQSAYNNVKPYSKKKLKQELDNITEWFKEYQYQYVMLLCNEQRDYTVFNFLQQNDKACKFAANELKECLTNRGKVLDIRYLAEDNAWEIWLRIGVENHAYMLFNCEQCILEVS